MSHWYYAWRSHRYTSLLEHFLRFKSMSTIRKTKKNKQTPEARKTLSPPGGLLAEQAYRRRMNRILSHCSLMLHYSVLACLFASVNFSFNVSGSFQDVDFLWMTRRDVTFPFARLCDANSDWLQGIFFFFSAFLCFSVLIY